MSFAWMRRIDFWLGKPIIWLLSLFTARARSLHGDVTTDRLPKRVICTKFIGMGSVVLSLPLLKALKDAGVEIAFWSFEGQADLARFSGHVDHVWIVRPTLRTFLPTLFSTIRAAWRFRADAFLDLEPTANFTAILARLSCAPTRIGFMSAKPLRESLFTHLVALTPERHMVENNLCMGRLLGLSGSLSNSLPFDPTSLDKINDILPPSPARKRVVVNINSSDLSWHRMWAEDSWVKVCEELFNDPTVDLVFPGAKSERKRVDSLVARLSQPDRIFNVAGQTSLIQLVKLIRGAQLAISVDSGIMHIAAWTATPLVAMFGPETPRLYGPRSAVARVLWAALPCSPCLSVAADKITRCRANTCMTLISPGRVLLAARSMLEAHSQPAATPKSPAVAVAPAQAG